jgi:hypothetical protein
MKLNKNQITRGNKWKENREKGIILSRTLRDIIHGYIMSDGYVSKEGGLQVDQSDKQAKFTEWLYEKLALLRTNTPIRTKTRYDIRTRKYTYSKSFQTKNLCKGFRSMWYEANTTDDGKIQYRKVLPKSLDCFFNVTFVTLWFAGDGNKMIDQRGAKFEATCFTPEERKRLQHLFKAKFDIDVKINKAGESKSKTQQWSLSINSSEYDKFRALITHEMDLIERLFAYKLHSKNP